MTVLDLARSHGVEIRLKADGSGIIFEADAAPPPDVVARLSEAKPILLHILTGREAPRRSRKIFRDLFLRAGFPAFLGRHLCNLRPSLRRHTLGARRAALLAERLRSRVLAIVRQSVGFLARRYAHDFDSVAMTAAGWRSPLGPVGIRGNLH